MARQTVGVHFDARDIAKIDKTLAELPIEMRIKRLPTALRAGGNVVKRRAVQKLKSIDRKSEADGEKFGHLRDTIKVVTRIYGNKAMALVGPIWPAGAPGYWVEYGLFKRGQVWVQIPGTNIKVKRKTPKKIPPRPFMRPAADETEQQQKAAVINSLKRSVERELKRA